MRKEVKVMTYNWRICVSSWQGFSCAGYFMAIWHNPRTIREEGASTEKKIPQAQAVGTPVLHFLNWWLRKEAYCGRCHPWAGGPGFYKKASWASHGEQANKQHPSVAYVSTVASVFLTCLSSCPDFLEWWAKIWKCRLNKLFLPNLLWSWWFIIAIVILTRTLKHNLCSFVSLSYFKPQCNPSYLRGWVRSRTKSRAFMSIEQGQG